MNNMPMCACAEFWNSHPPECPVRRKIEGLQKQVKAGEQSVPLNYVVYVAPTGCAYGPFSSKGHAECWATTGAQGFEYYVLRYVDLIGRNRDGKGTTESQVVCEHGIQEGEFCGHCAMVEV